MKVRANSPESIAITRDVGAALRGIRMDSLRLSLTGAAALTGGEFTAVAIASYERGERAMTVWQFVRLMGHYQRDLSEGLPMWKPPASDVRASADLRAIAGQLTEISDLLEKHEAEAAGLRGVA